MPYYFIHRLDVRSLIDMVVERNRMSCVNKVAVEAIIEDYWERFCKKGFYKSSAWYAAFLLSWTVSRTGCPKYILSHAHTHPHTHTHTHTHTQHPWPRQYPHCTPPPDTHTHTHTHITSPPLLLSPTPLQSPQSPSSSHCAQVVAYMSSVGPRHTEGSFVEGDYAVARLSIEIFAILVLI
jgi:hypothetical protein